MRNITVSVDDATYRRARIRAAELDTSVSALVRDYLGRLTGGRRSGQATANGEEPHADYLRRLDDLFTDWDARGIGLRGYDQLTREEVHDRERARLEMRLAVAERQRDALETEAAGATGHAAESSVPGTAGIAEGQTHV